MYFPPWQEVCVLLLGTRKQTDGLFSSIVMLPAITKQTQNFDVAYRRSVLLADEQQSWSRRFASSGAFASLRFLNKDFRTF